MSDANQQDPGGTGEDVDLTRFYRSEAEQLESARRTAGFHIDSFYRTTGADPARTTSSLHLEDYYRHPGDANEPIAIAGDPRSTAGGPAIGAPLPLPRLPQEPMPSSAALVPPAVAPAPAEIAPEANAETAALADEPAAPADEPAAAPAENGAGPAPAAPALPAAPKKSMMYRFAVMGAFLGIIFGAAIIALSWLLSNPSGPYDLGPANSSGVGLKGHLYTKWDGKAVQYRLIFEPIDASQTAAFAYTVANAPRPFSFAVQLKDAKGFVLCSRNILVKFDPAHAARSATAGATPAAIAANAQPAPVPDLASQQAKEAKREQGSDVFLNQTGSEGQVTSLSAQGAIPCSGDAYENLTNWSFVPDFPSVDEQSQLLAQSQPPSNEAQPTSKGGRKAVARKRNSLKAPAPVVFAIEGDDVVVGYEPGSGVLETSSGDSFYVDKESMQAAQSGWQTFPAGIHYRCDPASGCTLTRAGGGVVLHARRRR